MPNKPNKINMSDGTHLIITEDSIIEGLGHYEWYYHHRLLDDGYFNIEVIAEEYGDDYEKMCKELFCVI